jgi:hypothetical protein
MAGGNGTDLGQIGYTNENAGTRQVDRSAELRGIDQTLRVGKHIVDEGVKAKVTGEMLTSLDQAVADSEVSPIPFVEYDPRSREAHLSKRMDKLQGVIAQGRRSSVTAAQMQIDNILAEAQTKYPWLYDDLARRASVVVSGSAQFEQLGIDDQLRGQNAKDAQEQYERITGHAYKNWSDGGLGISEELDPRDPLFLKQYKERQEYRELYEESQITVGMALANAGEDMYGPEGDSLAASLQGRTNLIRGRLETVFQDNGFDRYKAAIGKDDPASLALLDSYHTDFARPVIVQLEAEKNALRDLFYDNIPPNGLETGRGKILKQQLEDALGEIDQIITSVNKTGEELPSSIQAIERAMAIRNAESFGGLSHVGQMQTAWFTSGPGKTYLEIIAKLPNPEGVIELFENALSFQSNLADLENLWAEGRGDPNPLLGGSSHGQQAAALFNSTGALNIQPGASGTEILDTIERRFRDPYATFVVPATGQEDNQALLLQTMDMHRQLWDLAGKTSSDASPEFADNVLLGETYSLHNANGEAYKPKNVQSYILGALADSATTQVIERSLQGGERGKREAWAMAAEDFYTNTNPQERRLAAGERYKQESYGGKALSELVFLDTGGLQHGRFELIFNEDVVTEAAKHQAAGGAGFMTTPADLERYKKKVRRSVSEAMFEIETEMRQQIEIEMNIARAKGSTRDIEFLSFFEGRGDPQAETMGTWYQMFNYAKR